MPVYKFQCQQCFIVSGEMSSNPNDAPSCCGGEPMVPIPVNSVCPYYEHLPEETQGHAPGMTKTYPPMQICTKGGRARVCQGNTQRCTLTEEQPCHTNSAS